MISSVGGLKRSSKTCPKAKIASLKGHGQCLVVCRPPDPLQLSESQWHHSIWEVRSANWRDALKTATPAASLGQQNGPGSPRTITTSVQKLNKLGYEVVPHLPYSPDLSPTDDHFFKHLNNFFQGKCFHNQQEAENTFQEFVESRNRFLHHRKKKTTTSFLLAKKCVDHNGPYFDE